VQTIHVEVIVNNILVMLSYTSIEYYKSIVSEALADNKRHTAPLRRVRIAHYDQNRRPLQKTYLGEIEASTQLTSMWFPSSTKSYLSDANSVGQRHVPVVSNNCSEDGHELT